MLHNEISKTCKSGGKAGILIKLKFEEAFISLKVAGKLASVSIKFPPQSKTDNDEGKSGNSESMVFAHHKIYKLGGNSGNTVNGFTLQFK